MGKFSSFVSLFILAIACAVLPSCGGGNPTTVVPQVAPTNVTIKPSTSISLELGKTQIFTATPANDRFNFQSSNPSVLTIANNGQACAGTWNSLTAPQVCTPGTVGTAQVTASTLGVTSSPVTVYVHAPISKVTISKVAGQPQTLEDSCLSRGAVHGPEHWLFQANAFSGNTDITASVGPFTWQQINPGPANIVTLAAPPSGIPGCQLDSLGQCLNQESVTASVPGVSQVFASASGFSSQPIPVETCRVRSISLAAAGDVETHTSFLVNTGTSTTLNATVTDAAGQKITGVPLTWSTSNRVSVGVSGSNTSANFGSVGTVSSPSAGAGTVIASCTPPTCNAGIQPSLPIYPQAAINFQVQNTSSTAALPTVYVSTTACTDPVANPSGASCTPTVVAIAATSATSPFNPGFPIALKASPNSFLFDSSGKAYFGVDSGRFGQQGVMIFDGSSVSSVTNAPGKVLAISPDQSSVIISDTKDSPNQVFVCTNCSASTRSVTSFPITGATAAAFSPDSLKAYILAGSNLYVYSKLDPLQTITLSATANDVTFHPEGGFAYLAGPGASVSPYRTCDNSPIATGNVGTANSPLLIRALPDGASFLAIEPPNVDLVSAALSFTPAGLCTTTVTDTVTSFNLGQGVFTPTKLAIAPNGGSAYILGETQAGPPPSRLPFVIVFNISTQTPSVISLANGATPLSMSISPAGNFLFVGADDGTVHVIETASGSDIQQVAFPFPTNELCFGPGNPATQVPLSQIKVMAASQNGGSTTYSYALISGPSLKVGQSITVGGMSDGGNNGTFTISALGTDTSGNATFTVTNSTGATANSQSGTGTVPIPCDPDLLEVKP